MDLKNLFEQVQARIGQVDFSRLWTGFYPLKFALYNEVDCFFDGAYVPKTKDFLANTAILYEGFYIAIWHVTGDEDIDILASKLIHEMFHGFQKINQESRFPNEMEALSQYCYEVENMSVKQMENQCIASLVKDYDGEKLARLLQLRRYRKQQFPNEYAYEGQVEQIEGTANYVELAALHQISPIHYEKAMAELIKSILEPKYIFPVRILSYGVGALLIHILLHHTTLDVMGFCKKTISDKMIEGIFPYTGKILKNQEIVSLIQNYHQKTKVMIQNAVSQNECVVSGPFKLMGVNIYDARYFEGYIVSTHFVSFLEGEDQKILYGDFVIQIDENHQGLKIYRK